MRTRTLFLAPLAAAALLLSACTSGPEPEAPEETTDDAVQTSASDVGVVQPPSGNGYLCRYVSDENQEAVTGAAWGEPVQITTADSEDTWTCEARDGEEPIVRVSIFRGEELPAQQRSRAQEEGLERGGPDHLGEAYLGNREVTTMTMCRVLDTEGSQDYEPYSFVVEALPEGDEDVRDDLSMVATAMARGLDQAIGCSPKMALQNAPDDAAATTAP